MVVRPAITLGRSLLLSVPVGNDVTRWLLLTCVIISGFSHASERAARQWVEHEFQPSTLAVEDQMTEMRWFIKAASPFRGMQIEVVSEQIATHAYESTVMAKAFFEITGIRVVHHLVEEGRLVHYVQQQMAGDQKFDMFVNDSDLIGTHYRSGKVVPLSDFMVGEGKDVTLPSLDIEDFIGRSFVTAPDGKLYQLPDQQFANLYWFRYDWFSRKDIQDHFRSLYGYELGVPLNWSAYEDIAEFFTHSVKTIDGKRVYGHMDYGKRHFSLGWRFSDAWFSMAGLGDKGLPNGVPVDEWGIRVDGCNPVGASVARGGALNSPAAVYAVSKFKHWLDTFAPPSICKVFDSRKGHECKAPSRMTFNDAGGIPALGNIAQQIFWYTAFTADMTKPGIAVVNDDGSPKWRMAPSPKGAYWQSGMKRGYQDAGAWTMFANTALERRKAAWLYAQFVVSKSTSLRKLLVGLTPIRKSDVNSKLLDQIAGKYGGLIEFYRSPESFKWTPTGTNVPDYPAMAPLWWKEIGLATYANRKSPQQVLDSFANKLDKMLGRLQKQGMVRCTPRLNPKRSKQYWLDHPGSPKPKLANEKPPGRTIEYEKLLAVWQQNRSSAGAARN